VRKKDKEIKQIELIAKNNGYNMNNIKSCNKYRKNKFTTDTTSLDTEKKLTKFIYFAEDIRILTKIFKNTALKVAYTVSNHHQ
jgi:hypothetical protein